MGPDGVVVVDPRIEFSLGALFGIEDATGEKLGAKASMKALDFSGGRGRAGSSQQMIDAIFPTDLVEENFHFFVGVEATSEDLAVVGQDLLGNSVKVHCVSEVVTDRARCCPDHQPCHDTEPRVIIHAG